MSTPTPIVVTRCDGCPFEGFTRTSQQGTRTDSRVGCVHRNAPTPWPENQTESGGHPEWCPLLTAPTLVVLEPNDQGGREE